MGDPAEEAHGDVDHGLGHVETALVVPDQAPPADHPAEGPLHHLTAGRTVNPPVRLQQSRGEDLLRTSSRSDDKDVGRASRAERRREHASRQLVAGVISRQGDAALGLILLGPCGVELLGGGGRRGRQGRFLPGPFCISFSEEAQGRPVRRVASVDSGGAKLWNEAFLFTWRRRGQACGSAPGVQG